MSETYNQISGAMGQNLSVAQKYVQRHQKVYGIDGGEAIEDDGEELEI